MYQLHHSGVQGPKSCSLAQLKLWLKCRGISSTNMTKAQAVDVFRKSLSNSYLMSQHIMDPKYPHYTDKKIQKLRQSRKLTESMLWTFPSRNPPVFPSAPDKWKSVDSISSETISYLKMYSPRVILNYYSVIADQRDTGFHNRALMRGSQHHAAGHVTGLLLCLQDPRIVYKCQCSSQHEK